MIEASEFARLAELELHASRQLSPLTYQAWKELPRESKAAFASAVALVGGPMTGLNGSTATAEADRIAAARLMLLKLGLDGPSPAWSSEILARVVRAALEPPGGAVSDLLGACFDVLGDYQTELSPVVANLLKDLVVACFTRQRSSYEATDWPRFLDRVRDDPTNAQLYFLHLAVPPQHLPPELERSIQARLEGSPLGEKAGRALAG